MSTDIRVQLVRNQASMLRIARKLCRSSIDAADIVQDACVLVLSRTWEPAAYPKSWFGAFVRHAFMKKRERGWRHVQMPDDYTPPRGVPDPFEPAVDAPQEYAYELAELFRFLATLPDHQGLIFWMAAQGYVCAEMVPHVGVGQSVVQQRLGRSRKAVEGYLALT